MRVTILGSGAAGGVPTISRGWGVCDPGNPKNRRRRPSILVEEGETAVMVDSSPDCREQLLDAGVHRLDAVLYTHDHADHLHGIDDLREVNRAMRAALPIYGAPETIAGIRDRFPYVIGNVENGHAIYKPMLVPHEVSSPFTVGPLTIQPFDQDHGYCRSLGYRFGEFAYSTDVVKIPEASMAILAGVKVWVIGCLSLDPHPTHAHLGQVLEWVREIKPERAYLTHMTPSLDYEATRKLLPANMEPAYDGLVINV